MLALVLSAALTAQLQETITVQRVLVDVRVTTYAGEPVTGLRPADFDVRIGGKRAVVEAAEWIDESSSLRVDESSSTPTPVPLDDSTTRRLDDPPGRLLVLFVQTDFTRDRLRTHGQMRFMKYAEEIIEALEPRDRMAVFSFDSHLKFRLDFSDDKARLREALRDTLWIDHPPPPPAVPEPSLAPRLDRQAMRRAASSERAMTLVADALRPIPGPKSMLLLGWGLGQLTPMGVTMKPEWKVTRQALDAARVTIFALDTTSADYHSLEHGLKSAAAQTGGFYARTYHFPALAVARLRRTLAGRYELTLRASAALQPGTRGLDVRVKRRGVHVLAPYSVVIRH